jgi:hypothetical protein
VPLGSPGASGSHSASNQPGAFTGLRLPAAAAASRPLGGHISSQPGAPCDWSVERALAPRGIAGRLAACPVPWDQIRSQQIRSRVLGPNHFAFPPLCCWLIGCAPWPCSHSHRMQDARQAVASPFWGLGGGRWRRWRMEVGLAPGEEVLGIPSSPFLIPPVVGEERPISIRLAARRNSAVLPGLKPSC